jgi:transposase-like protein
VDTIRTPSEDGRRRRRRHSAEFKADVVASCCKPGVSIASVALANGVNANLVRRWMIAAEAGVDRGAPRVASDKTKALAVPPSFVALQLPAPSSSQAASTPAATHIEVTRGLTKIVMTWPVTAVAECAALIRELLR